MTQDLTPQQQQAPAGQTLPEQQVRYIPAGPRGPGSRQQAQDLIDFGADAAARGLTQSLVSKYFGKMQDVALQAILGSSSELLELMDQVSQAKLMEIAAAINQLPQVTMAQMLAQAQPLPQTGLKAWLGVNQTPPQYYVDPSTPQPALISRDAVLQIVAAAIAQARSNG